jgi:hypothetical protein
MLTVAQSEDTDEPEPLSLRGLAIQISHLAQLAEVAATRGGDVDAREHLERIRFLLASAHLRRVH